MIPGLNVRNDGLPIQLQGAFHALGGRARRRQQRCHKAPRFLGVEHDAFASFDGLQCRLARLCHDETADRLPGEGGRMSNHGLVVGRNPGNQPLPLLRLALCHRQWHTGIVHPSGTQVKP